MAVNSNCPTESARPSAASEIDELFNQQFIRDLAKIAKAPADADLSRSLLSICVSARNFLEEKTRKGEAGIRKEVERLYKLTRRAERSDEGARQLAYAIRHMSSDVRSWLERFGDVPAAGEIESEASRAGSIRRLRVVLSYGGHMGEGRTRPGGKVSKTFFPLLRVPGQISEIGSAGIRKEVERLYKGRLRVVLSYGRDRFKRGRPPGLAEREFIRNLTIDYFELTGKRAPFVENFQNPGPFSSFVQACFQRLGEPVGNVTRLINELGTGRSRSQNGDIQTYCTHADPPPIRDWPG